MKKFRKIMALALAMSLALIPAASHAEGGNAQTVTKVLENKNTNAVVPKEDFSFQVKASDEVTEAPSNISPETYPTPVVKGVDGGITVAKASYTHETMELTQKPEITVNAEKFTSPGIYRYEISETKGSTDGMTYSDQTYVLDVYMVNDENNSGKMKVQGVVSFEKGKATEGKKDMAFKNVYDTKDLTVTKKVTGNQGDKNKEFSFTVTIKDANPGTIHSFKYQIGSDSTMKTAVVSDGTATIEGKLKDGQSIKVFGLSPKDTYTVVERDANKDGYKTTGEEKQAKEMGDKDVTVTVTNDRNTTVPTGVISTIAPFVLIIAAVGVFAVIYFKKSRIEA